MASPEKSETILADEQLDRAIGALLRFGVLVAAALVLVGGIVFLARHGGDSASYRVFHGESPDFRHIKGVLAAAREFRGRGLIMAGLLVLMATPVARVALCVFTFAKQRDFKFAVITLIVLALLLLVMAGAR